MSEDTSVFLQKNILIKLCRTTAGLFLQTLCTTDNSNELLLFLYAIVSNEIMH